MVSRNKLGIIILGFCLRFLIKFSPQSIHISYTLLPKSILWNPIFWKVWKGNSNRCSFGSPCLKVVLWSLFLKNNNLVNFRGWYWMSLIQTNYWYHSQWNTAFILPLFFSHLGRTATKKMTCMTCQNWRMTLTLRHLLYWRKLII